MCLEAQTLQSPGPTCRGSEHSAAAALRKVAPCPCSSRASCIAGGISREAVPHPCVLPTGILQKGELLLHPQARKVSCGDSFGLSNQIVWHESAKGDDCKENFSLYIGIRRLFFQSCLQIMSNYRRDFRSRTRTGCIFRM